MSSFIMKKNNHNQHYPLGWGPYLQKKFTKFQDKIKQRMFKPQIPKKHTNIKMTYYNYNNNRKIIEVQVV